MPVQVVAESDLLVGTPTFVAADSPTQALSVVFEDNGETAYFYALHHAMSDNPIVDALHIYNVENVSDRDRPSKVHIAWSIDGMKAILMINAYPHAVFDFVAHRGYCRTGFPPVAGKWSLAGHDWDDEALKLFD